MRGSVTPRTVLAAGGALDPEGPAAASIAGLWWLMLGLAAAVFALVLVLLLGGLLRRRPAPDPSGEGGAGARAAVQQAAAEARLVRRWIVAGGVALPIVVLVVVLGATVDAMRDLRTTAPDGALVVEVVGHQYWWEVRYPDEGVVTANELHLPVGRPVAVRLTSADVIHSFWVPALAGKADALPDGTTTLVLEASEPGEHASECAEFCGLQHAQMGVTVVAEPEGRFADWVAARRAPAAEPADAAARRGRDAFLAADCAACHAVRGTPADGEAGPDLTHLASRPTLGAATVPNTPEHLAAWVADPHTVKEGVAMPAAVLSEEQLADVVAYLGTLR